MDFLFEIGLEEVPARMIAGAQAELVRRTAAMLGRERLVEGECDAVGYSTPRRLAVLVRGVKDRQEDVAEELMGPAAKIAFKDGVAGPAAVAFAKKSGVAVEDLKVVSTQKGDYVSVSSVKAGRGAVEVIAAEMPKELAGIYWAKNMYWRAGKPERFVRPVRWLLAMLGEESVPVSFGGYTAGTVTYGHRVLYGADAIEIGAPEEYVGALQKAYVMADVELRRHTIRNGLDEVCRTVEGARWREDHALVDKMTHLTEWPSVIVGSFEAEYLALPEEVLVTVMRDHQNYFAVEEGEGRGKREEGREGAGSRLAPYFLAVLNTVTDERGEAVIRHGNERVLRARFNDAKFFWEFDQRVPMEDRVALLEKVTFQKDLGSYAAKTSRVEALVQELGRMLSERGVAFDREGLWAAARLAKADLTTELVKEFTELQGEVGGLYARTQGVSETACAAIYDQYRPTSTEDRIPRTVEGQLLAIADKADTIAGMFGLGMEPTGSKDPFALRRAANGIVKILAEGKVSLTVEEVIAASGAPEAVAGKMAGFFAERVEFYLREVKGQAYDVVKAVLAVGAGDVKDAVARSEAVTAVRGSEDFVALSQAFKRMRNILAQVKDNLDESVGIDIEYGVPEQAQLHLKTREVGLRAMHLAEDHQYEDALKLIATLRPEIDAFFDRVMVMDPDAEVRVTRLKLLRSIVLEFSKIADFSEIVAAG